METVMNMHDRAFFPQNARAELLNTHHGCMAILPSAFKSNFVLNLTESQCLPWSEPIRLHKK